MGVATTSADHPARLLWREMQSTVVTYPDGVGAVPEPIEGTAFLPDGYGLWRDLGSTMCAFPTEQIMIVGQDFNSRAAYEEARLIGTETQTSPTWRNLISILSSVEVAPERCFFTNVYMGLRDGGPETGRFAGASDPGFVACCLQFFERQLEVSRPRLILLLGLEPLRVLSRSLLTLPAPATLTASAGIYDAASRAGGSSAVVSRADTPILLSRKRLAPKVRDSHGTCRGAGDDRGWLPGRIRRKPYCEPLPREQ